MLSSFQGQVDRAENEQRPRLDAGGFLLSAEQPPAPAVWFKDLHQFAEAVCELNKSVV